MLFKVIHPKFGELQVQRDTRAEVEAWIAEAFPREKLRIVKAEIANRCKACDSAPCCCPRENT